MAAEREEAEIDADVCVAGGGPAGMMAGLLFARAGHRVVVLEKHADFLRDFRGDTVHPSTLEIFRELGLLDAFLEHPHQRMAHIRARFSGRFYDVADFSGLAVACRFIAFMPQHVLLGFLAETAARYPGFRLLMETRASGLIETDGAVTGVRAVADGRTLAVRARLTIGADGRDSALRACAGLPIETAGAPIDVLWFALPRRPDHPNEVLFHAVPGSLLVTIDRGDYWQCAWVIGKDTGERIRARGVEAFRGAIVSAVPEFADAVEALRSFDDISLLTVRIERLQRWARPGLVMIGDAAHAMSPIGGVGINLAVQDAVAAANLLAGPLANGTLAVDDLDRLQRRRQFAVRATQFVQTQMQQRLLVPLLREGAEAPPAPLPLRLLDRSKALRRLAGRMIGLGARPEHVERPERA